jgi:hypothetical protein
MHETPIEKARCTNTNTLMMKWTVSCLINHVPESTSLNESALAHLSSRIVNLKQLQQKILGQIKTRLRCHWNDSKDLPS